MNIGFLHISDIHDSENIDVPLKQEKIVNAIKSAGNIDHLILICSGDLAYSGTKLEYDRIKCFSGSS